VGGGPRYRRQIIFGCVLGGGYDAHNGEGGRKSGHLCCLTRAECVTLALRRCSYAFLRNVIKLHPADVGNST
jgi:hypothetical protein